MQFGCAAFDDSIQVSDQPVAPSFGSTVLTTGARQNRMSRRVMASLNEKGIFSNTEDDLQALERALRVSFTDVHVTTRGTVALFTGRRAAL